MAFWAFYLLLIKLQQLLRWVGGVFLQAACVVWEEFFTKLGLKSYLIFKNEIRVNDYQV
jgi:hypothetical protein